MQRPWVHCQFISKVAGTAFVKIEKSGDLAAQRIHGDEVIAPVRIAMTYDLRESVHGLDARTQARRDLLKLRTQFLGHRRCQENARQWPVDKIVEVQQIPARRPGV